MSLSFPAMRTGLSESAADARRKQIVAVVLPLALLLVWTCVLRLPFYEQTDKDEFFFSVIASEWLRGGLPYVATFDVKPPGLFFIYAAAQSLFGASQATIKSMEIVAVAFGAYGLYRLMRTNGTPRAALWLAFLYPVYTLTLSGTVAVSLIIQLPFLILAFAAILSAVRNVESARTRLRHAFLAGLAIGAAGMIKQTAIFEATAIFATLCLYGERRRLVSLAGLFVLGAALPAAAFSLYFFAAGHFHEMFQSVVMLALQRTDDGVISAYGPDFASYFTLSGLVENTLAVSAPLLFLAGGAIFAVIRLERIRQVLPTRLLVIAGLWLVGAIASVMAGKVLCTYYALTLVPPLLILAGAGFVEGVEGDRRQRSLAFGLTLVLAIASMAYIDRRDMFTPNAFIAGDYDASRRVSRKLFDLGLVPQDRLLVLNRGFSVYTETGAFPPSPYFHPLHLLGVFRTPSPDPLGESLEANPRFIVVANPAVRHVTELQSRLDRTLAYVGAHYRPAATIAGARDSFTIYEFVG